MLKSGWLQKERDRYKISWRECLGDWRTSIVGSLVMPG